MQFEGNTIIGNMIAYIILFIFTSNSDTPYSQLVMGAMAVKADGATALESEASTNRTRFTYRQELYCNSVMSIYDYLQSLQLKEMAQLSQIILAFFILTSFVISGQFTPKEEEFIVSIKQILDSHLVEGQKWGMKYHFYRPGLQKYGPYQWLWDSAFHMISWSRLNVTNSILDLRTMLQKQNNRTFQIPQMIFWGHQGIKDILINHLLASDPTVTDISQMPMLAFSLQRIYEETGDRQLLKEFVPKLVQYYEWWAKFRQPDRDGLIVIIHPWESGLDASPMYDEALGVSNFQPSLKELYPQFEQLIISYKLFYGWNQKKIVSPKKHKIAKKWPTYFVVKEVGVNAVYTASWKILADLALQLDNQPLNYYCLSQYRHFVAGIQKLFDQSKNRYVSKYLSKDQYLTARADTVQSLFPILIPEIKQSHRNAILESLRDPKQYKSDFPIPTVSQSDPTFNPVFTIDLMWRGPSWAAPNYFILEGLKRLNQTQLYKQIGQKWVDAAMQKGIWEMWNPLTGQGYGVKDLGMSTSVIDVLFKLKNL